MSPDFCSYRGESQLPLGVHVAQTCLPGLTTTSGPEAHDPAAPPKLQKASSAVPQNSPALPALPSVGLTSWLVSFKPTTHTVLPLTPPAPSSVGPSALTASPGYDCCRMIAVG